MKKSSKKVKKVSKKKSAPKKKVAQKVKKVVNEIVVRVQPQETQIAPIREKDLEPEQNAGKYRVVQSWLSEKQVLRMIQKTPAQVILKRKGRGGQVFDYVPGWYFKKALNFGFGWNWDFKIVKQEIIGTIGNDGTQVVTTGQLTVKDDKGHTITKEDNGKADIKYLKGTKIPMDIGNDYKSSATDALKRCCVQLGICSDVYGKGEMKEEGYTVNPDKPTGPALPPAKSNETRVVPDHSHDNIVDYVCSRCGEDITPAEGEFSKKVFKKMLCRNHQKEAKDEAK